MGPVPAAQKMGPGPILALTNARIHTVAGAVIEKGTIVIAGGRITVVGADVAVPAGEQEVSADGYAREMGEDFNRRAAVMYAEQVPDVDIVITTALIPGRPAPRLITGEMVASMKSGSVIVDMAAAQGGNVAGSVADFFTGRVHGPHTLDLLRAYFDTEVSGDWATASMQTMAEDLAGGGGSVTRWTIAAMLAPTVRGGISELTAALRADGPTVIAVDAAAVGGR